MHVCERANLIFFSHFYIPNLLFLSLFLLVLQTFCPYNNFMILLSVYIHVRIKCILTSKLSKQIKALLEGGGNYCLKLCKSIRKCDAIWRSNLALNYKVIDLFQHIITVSFIIQPWNIGGWYRPSQDTDKTSTSRKSSCTSEQSEQAWTFSVLYVPKFLFLAIILWWYMEL